MGKGELLLHSRCRFWARVWETELFNSKHPLHLLCPNSKEVHMLRMLRLSFIAGWKMLWFYLYDKNTCWDWSWTCVPSLFPSSWEVGDYLFTYKQFPPPPNRGYIKRGKAEICSIWTRSLQMFPLTWDRAQAAVLVPELQDRGLIKEYSRKAIRDTQNQEEEQKMRVGGEKWGN